MCAHGLAFFVTFNFFLPAACFLEAKWFLRMLFLELNISLHTLQNSFPPRRHKFSPGNSSIRSRGLMFFGSELPLSLYFPVLLLGTRLKLSVRHRKWWKGMYSRTTPCEGPSRRAISVVAWVSVLCTGWPLPPAGPYLTMGLSTDLNIFQQQYRAMMGFFVFNA